MLSSIRYSLQPFQSLFPYVALVLVYIALGTTFGSIRIALFYMSPDVVVVWRFALAALVLLPLGLILSALHCQPIDGSVCRLRWNLLVGLLVFVVGNGVLCYPLQHISSGMAAGIIAFSPFFMLGFSRFIPPTEPFTRPVFNALMVGLMGMALLATGYQVAQNELSGGMTTIQWLSMVLMMGVNMCWVAGSLMVRRQAAPLPQLCADTGIQCLTAVAVFAIVALLKGHTLNILDYPLSATAALLYLAWMGTCIGMLCYFYALKTLPLALTGSFAYVTPMLTMILGVLFLDEPASWPMWVGMIVILTSVILIHRVTHRRQSTSLPHPPAPQQGLSVPQPAEC